MDYVLLHVVLLRELASGVEALNNVAEVLQDMDKFSEVRTGDDNVT